jgi:hypothetical protein
MADDVDHISVVLLCDAMDGGSPAGQLGTELMIRFVEPAIPRVYEHDLSAMSFKEGPTVKINHSSLSSVANADLVVVDLTDISVTADFLIGAREYQGFPIVYIVDDQTPYSYSTINNVVKYSRANYATSIPALEEQIRFALEGRPDEKFPTLTPRPERINREEMAKRIEAAVKQIRDLRINSLSDQVEELAAIASELRKNPSDSSPSALRQAADKCIKIIFAMMDELATKEGAQAALSGIIALIVAGGGGVSTVGAFTALLAFWKGKEAFADWMKHRDKKAKD